MNPAFAEPGAPVQITRAAASALTDAEVAAQLAAIQPYDVVRSGLHAPAISGRAGSMPQHV